MGWRTARHRRRAQKSIERSQRALAQGDLLEASAYSVDAARAAEQAAETARRSGDELRYEKDRRVLASLRYNDAAIQEAQGEIKRAYLRAQEAFEIYREFDPTGGDPNQVRTVLEGWRQAPVSVPVTTDQRGHVVADSYAIRDPEEYIGQAADAGARLTRLTARMWAAGLGDELRMFAADLPTPAGMVEQVGAPAVETYRQLLAHGRRYTQADLGRVTQQLEHARAKPEDHVMSLANRDHPTTRPTGGDGAPARALAVVARRSETTRAAGGPC